MANAKVHWGRGSGLAPPPFVIALIAASRYAALVASDMNLRRLFLSEIASLHTKSELSGMGLGSASIKKIEEWLLRSGTRLRLKDESLDAVICGFGTRKLVRLKRRMPGKPRAMPQHETHAA